MKKNAMLKIAAILLVAVLLTTCAISATFAKYVTTNALNANQNARVAKWGITVDFTGNGTDDAVDMFKTQYTKGTETVVVSDNRVVAPGTANDNALTVEISGTPEVAFKIESDLDVTLTGWKVDTDGDGTADDDYMPLVFYIAKNGGTKQKIEAADLKTYLNDGIEEAIMGGNPFVAPGTTQSLKFTISWEWAYEGGNDAYDTLLGNAATATVGFTGGITVSQYGSDFAK